MCAKTQTGSHKSSPLHQMAENIESLVTFLKCNAAQIYIQIELVNFLCVAYNMPAPVFISLYMNVNPLKTGDPLNG